MNYLGLASMWDGLPHVKDYFSVLIRRPSLTKESIQASVKSMPPSIYMNAIANS
jgi:hypothetical protein